MWKVLWENGQFSMEFLVGQQLFVGIIIYVIEYWFETNERPWTSKAKSAKELLTSLIDCCIVWIVLKYLNRFSSFVCSSIFTGCFVQQILAQNGSSRIENNTHHNDDRYLNNLDTCRMPSLTANLHTPTAAAKMTTFDQHTNPFVFKCEMNFFRKIRVRANRARENVEISWMIEDEVHWKCVHSVFIRWTIWFLGNNASWAHP